MKIVILGAGRVGSSLAKNLSTSDYEITIIDERQDLLNDLDENYDLAIIKGHASNPKILEKAGLNSDSIVISVTNNDEVNIVSCQLAKEIFKVKKTICRFKDPVYLEYLEKLSSNPVDVAISPENEVTSHLIELINHPGAEQIEEFASGKVKLVSVKAKKSGKLYGRELKHINDDLPEIQTYIPAIYRKNKPFIPSGKDIIKENDEVYFVSSAENIDSIVDEFRDHEESYSRLMIIGGGKIGYSLAKSLEDDFKIKIIEENIERSEEISKKLNKTIVLNGSATDEMLLKSENITNIDVFCALTNDDETNVMSSLLAKKMGAKKTMIILNNPSYLGLVPGFIDIYIAPYRLTVSSVLQDLRESDVAQDVMLKMDSGAEAIEGIVHANEYTSKLFGNPVTDISMPEGAAITAIVRHDKVLMPSEEIKLQINDHLIVFLADKTKVKELELLFKN